jgi:hypothetical protein
LEEHWTYSLYEEHSVWRFENLLGRTMWEFSGQPGLGEFSDLEIHPWEFGGRR